MATETMTGETIYIPGAPDIPGLRFRRFAGESDYPAMVDVLNASHRADQDDYVANVPNLAATYANLKNCDPYRDIAIIEVNGEMVGYTRTEWYTELEGSRIYSHLGFTRPEWRRKGIGRVLFHYNEQHLRDIAADHPDDGPRFYQADAGETARELVGLLAEEGYEPVRFSFEMVRPDLENLPDFPLPEGIEARAVTPDQYRAIYDAEVEAFRDHWGAWQEDEEDFEHWLHGWPDFFQPNLWQVAWEGDQVVGMVRNFIQEPENREFGRLRGYTENISVRRPWRRQGVARALIARSFKMLRDLGMKEAALGVDTQNPNGALQLYESMGFQVAKRSAVYRKPMPR